MPVLPPELLWRVTDFCQLSEILSLLSVNRYLHIHLIDGVYRSIKIDSPNQLSKMSDAVLSEKTVAGRPPLRLVPRALAVKLVGHKTAAFYGLKIVDLICALSNLRDLSLHLPHRLLNGIFVFERVLAAPLKLRRFDCGTTSSLSTCRFLNQQTQIEALFTAHHSSPDEIGKIEVPAELAVALESFLPNLQYLQASTKEVARIAPGRPISRIHVVQHLYQSESEACALSLSRVTVPLVSFCITAVIHGGSDYERLISFWLHNLACWGHSLKNVEFRIKLIRDLPISTNRNSNLVNAELLFAVLNPYKALLKFSVTVVDSQWRPPSVDQLSNFEFWKKACPSLVHVSYLEYVLSES